MTRGLTYGPAIVRDPSVVTCFADFRDENPSNARPPPRLAFSLLLSIPCKVPPLPSGSLPGLTLPCHGNKSTSLGPSGVPLPLDSLPTLSTPHSGRLCVSCRDPVSGVAHIRGPDLTRLRGTYRSLVALPSCCTPLTSLFLTPISPFAPVPSLRPRDARSRSRGENECHFPLPNLSDSCPFVGRLDTNCPGETKDEILSDSPVPPRTLWTTLTAPLLPLSPLFCTFTVLRRPKTHTKLSSRSSSQLFCPTRHRTLPSLTRFVPTEAPNSLPFLRLPPPDVPRSDPHSL